MKVIDVFHIKGRGPVVSVAWDADVLPRAGEQVRRLADGSYWTIRGVERHAIERRSWNGIGIGLLLPADTTVVKDDDVEAVRT